MAGLAVLLFALPAFAYFGARSAGRGFSHRAEPSACGLSRFLFVQPHPMWPHPTDQRINTVFKDTTPDPTVRLLWGYGDASIPAAYRFDRTGSFTASTSAGVAVPVTDSEDQAEGRPVEWKIPNPVAGSTIEYALQCLNGGVWQDVRRDRFRVAAGATEPLVIYALSDSHVGTSLSGAVGTPGDQVDDDADTVPDFLDPDGSYLQIASGSANEDGARAQRVQGARDLLVSLMAATPGNAILFDGDDVECHCLSTACNDDAAVDEDGRLYGRGTTSENLGSFPDTYTGQLRKTATRVQAWHFIFRDVLAKIPLIRATGNHDCRIFVHGVGYSSGNILYTLSLVGYVYDPLESLGYLSQGETGTTAEIRSEGNPEDVWPTNCDGTDASGCNEKDNGADWAPATDDDVGDFYGEGHWYAVDMGGTRIIVINPYLYSGIGGDYVPEDEPTLAIFGSGIPNCPDSESCGTVGFRSSDCISADFPAAGCPGETENSITHPQACQLGPEQSKWVKDKITTWTGHTLLVVTHPETCGGDGNITSDYSYLRGNPYAARRRQCRSNPGGTLLTTTASAPIWWKGAIGSPLYCWGFSAATGQAADTSYGDMLCDAIDDDTDNDSARCGDAIDPPATAKLWGQAQDILKWMQQYEAGGSPRIAVRIGGHDHGMHHVNFQGIDYLNLGQCCDREIAGWLDGTGDGGSFIDWGYDTDGDTVMDMNQAGIRGGTLEVPPPYGWEGKTIERLTISPGSFRVEVFANDPLDDSPNATHGEKVHDFTIN